MEIQGETGQISTHHRGLTAKLPLQTPNNALDLSTETQDDIPQFPEPRTLKRLCHIVAHHIFGVTVLYPQFSPITEIFN